MTLGGKKPAIPEIDVADLLASFDSLGDNCEFGIFQRACGYEPLGLLRFASARLPSLTDAILARFEGVFDREDFDIFVGKHDDQLICRSRAYNDFDYYPQVRKDEVDIEQLIAVQTRRNAWLKGKLLDQLATGETIYVRKGPDSDARSVRELFRALRSHGPSRLLVVVETAGDRPAGRVETVEDGLFVGYVSKLAPYGDVRRCRADEWLIVCRETYALVHGAVALRANRLLNASGGWPATESCEVVVNGEIARMTPRRDYAWDWIQNCKLGIGSVPSRLVVFSMWIWLPERFSGTMFESFIGSPKCSGHPLDDRRRRCWQRIWSSAMIAEGCTTVDVCLVATIAAGEPFFTASWKLEEGTVPTLASPPLVDPETVVFDR